MKESWGSNLAGDFQPMRRRVLARVLPAALLVTLALLLQWSEGAVTADAGPHGGYSLVTDACARCHRTHTSQGPSLIYTSTTGNAFCFSCHDGTGATVPPFVSTHSNNAFPTRQEGVFELACVQCHEPHGHPTNLLSVREDTRVTNSPILTTGPVVFTSRTGADSFDEADASDADDLCATCHSNASNPGFPMNSHVGGDHTAAGGADERGNDCATCHVHDLDDDFLTADGFMPSGCTGCHVAPQDNGDGNPSGGRRAVVGEFGASTHHVQGTLQDSDCQVCHDMTTHSNGIVELVDGDNGSTIYTESGSGNFRNATMTAADVTNLTSFCQSCHDGDGAVRLGGAAMAPFSGATSPVAVNTHSNTDFSDAAEQNFQAGCAQCHESHGSSNLALVKGEILVTPDGTTTGPVAFLAFTGTDSFDEDDLGETDDLCATCHINPGNPGFPMTSHPGGDHTPAGGADERGNDCRDCHSHDKDGDTGTLDGFMPSGCIDCHASPQGGRRQIVDSNSDGTGTGGDFLRTSHHVNGSIPTNGDCVVCHDQSAHKQGTVRLRNVDTGAGSAYTTGADLEPFCLACHDANGAAGSPPFSDLVMPPVIDATDWSNASHDTTKPGYTGTCYECHNNGHGSNKANLLAPWDDPGGGPADDPLEQEEFFCYGCHSAVGVAATDVAGTFAPATNWINNPPTAVTAVVGTNGLVTLNDRHDIAASDQAISNSTIECVNCHNPHVANSTNKLILDPDPTDGRIPGTGYVPGGDYMTDWCLDCHDGSLPPGVTDGHQDDRGNPDGMVDVLTLWDGNNNKDDTHGAQNGGVGSIEPDPPGTDGWVVDITVQCLDCHVRHLSAPNTNPGQSGRTNLYHLKNLVTTRDGSATLNSNANTANGGTPDQQYELSIVHTFVSDNQNGYSYCNTCHDGTQMKSGEPNCTNCHMHGSRW